MPLTQEQLKQRGQSIQQSIAWIRANPELVRDGYRKCARCGHIGLQDSDFVPDSRARNGYRNQCKPCNNNSTKSYRRNNPEKVRALNKAYQTEHAEEFKASKKRSRAKHAKKMALRKRVGRLKKEYGLTPEQHDALLEKQHGLCVICERAPVGHRWSKLHVDHCHTTGKIRGLLCANCNLGIGNFQDSPDLMRAAIRYLESV